MEHTLFVSPKTTIGDIQLSCDGKWSLLEGERAYNNYVWSIAGDAYSM